MAEETQQSANTGTSAGAEQVKQDTQQAQQDLKQVADRAKAATEGFSFEKLFQGRIDNMNYLWLAIASLVASMILGMIPVIGWAISLALGIVGIGATIRRLHDIGQTGWLTLLCFIPFVGLLLVVYLCWKKGSGVVNQYGEAPDPKREFFKAALNT
jgi:uncharacterized membrane protein YhaH (DUF805 family)